MKILTNTNDLNVVLNTEQDFKTDLGWQENLAQFEDEVLKDIINPFELSYHQQECILRW